MTLALERCELWHNGEDAYATVFATPDRRHTRVNLPIPSSSCSAWLRHTWYAETGCVASEQAVERVAHTLAARARYDGPERPTGVRVGTHEGLVYVDLADRDGRAIAIGPDGWRVVTDCPVRFLRQRGMESLPIPRRGGSLESLRRS